LAAPSLLALATFAKGNPNAELWGPPAARCSSLHQKKFLIAAANLSFFGGAKSNSRLLRFTSGRKLEINTFWREDVANPCATGDLRHKATSVAICHSG
jgi:hypothetical protein